VASEVDIANMALSTVGSATTISSMSPPDGTAAAQHCANFYDLARREALAAFNWSFARKRAELTEAYNPSDVWTYSYTLPADCLRPIRVLQQAVPVDMLDNLTPAQAWQWRTERAGADFIVERAVDNSMSYLLTDEPDALLFYLFDQRDTARYSPQFTAALSRLLAAYIAGPILRGNAGAQAFAALRKQALGDDGKSGLLGQAAAQDGNTFESTSAAHTSDSIRARA
jgi:hypothetical protein